MGSIDQAQYFAGMGPVELDDPMDIYRHFLPYVIFRDADGTYLFLNRQYKPAGMVCRPGDWVDYGRCTQRFRVKGLTPEVAGRISARGKENAAWICLYHDGCRPQDGDKERRDYENRLKLFFDLVEIENVGAPVPVSQSEIA